MDKRSVEQQIRDIWTRFPNRARPHLREGHIHDLVDHVVNGSGSGGIVHYDYAVDASYTGTAGATVTMTGGSSTKMYATIQAAITAADADNAVRTIRVNGGAYSESVTIPSSVAHDLYILGEERSRVIIGTGAATSLTISTGTAAIYLKDLTLTGTSVVAALATTTSVELITDNVLLDGPMTTVGLDNSYLNRTRFARGWSNTATVSVVYVTDSYFHNSTLSTWTGTAEDVVFDNCIFTGTSGPSFSFTGAGDIDSLSFKNCTVSASGGWRLLHVNSATCSIGYLSFEGNYFLNAIGGSIYVQSCAASTGSIIVADNRFDPIASASTDDQPYVVCDDADATGWCIVGNAFGKSGSGYVEDLGGVSIKGVFVDSVIGPNSPPDFNLQLDATSSNVTYIGSGVVSGAAATSGIGPLPQRGAGVPTHTAPEGTEYWDTTNNNLYVNSDGGTTWQAIGGATATPTGGGAAMPLVIEHDEEPLIQLWVPSPPINPGLNIFQQGNTLHSWVEGASIASATALVLGADGDMFHVTGTTTITSITASTRHALVLLVFDGVVSLVHDATNLVLQGGVTYVTAAGDVFIFMQDFSGQWREVSRRLALPYTFVHYVIHPDEAPGVAIDAGVQSTVLHSGPVAETAVRMYGDVITSAADSGTATFTVRFIYWDSDDLDTIAVSATIAEVAMAEENTIIQNTMTFATIPANSIIQLNIVTVTANTTQPASGTFTLRVQRPRV